jgi:NUBPL iron-transfer P-loop NTPase
LSRRTSDRSREDSDARDEQTAPPASPVAEAAHDHSADNEEKNMVYENTIVVGGGKGGVGKSTCASAVIYCLTRAGKKPYLIETDTSNPDVAKAHQSADTATPALPMSMLDLDIEEGWLELLNVRAAHPDHVLVISTGSRSNLPIQRFGSLLAQGLEELSAPLVTLWMIDGNRDCLELLSQYRETLAAGPIHVLRNAHCARTFELYEQSNLRHELEQNGGLSLTFPPLPERVAQTLSAKRLSFAAAEASDVLPFGHKVALRRWLSDVSSVLMPVAA